MLEIILALAVICGIAALAVICAVIVVYQEVKNKMQQKQPQLLATTIAIESIGNHKVLLLSNGHVQVLTSQHRDLYMTPAEATSLYDFLLRNMAFIERRRDQNKNGN